MTKSYHTNGNLAWEGAVREGKPVGFWQYYREDGSISSEGNYSQDGIMCGLWKHFYPNGKISGEGSLRPLNEPVTIDTLYPSTAEFENGVEAKIQVSVGKCDNWKYYEPE